MTAPGLAESMAETAAALESVLEAELPAPVGPSARLHEAMRYAMLDGGKRLRGFLVRAVARMAGAPDDRALLVAAAVEMVHGYSLIHDDLPAMDDDDMRRGKPSCHVAFDEATAILAGDALLTQAFELLADPRVHPDAECRCALAAGLARAAGAKGMVGGQMIDLTAGQRSAGRDLIALLERMKTGALIAYSCEAGAILAGRGAVWREALREFGYDIGLAFQIVDDLLDVTGSEAELGKKVGKDADAGKATLITGLGIDGARREAASLVDNAVDRLAVIGEDVRLLRAFGEFVLARRS